MEYIFTVKNVKNTNWKYLRISGRLFQDTYLNRLLYIRASD